MCVGGWVGEGGGTIDKGVLACGKGNHGAEAWVARVRVSAHTVWMRSSFPLLRKLPMNHMLRVPHSLRVRHSLLTRYRSSQMKHCSSRLRRNFQRGRRFRAARRLPDLRTLAAPSTSPGARWRRPGPVWWMVGAAEEEEDWCRHTGGTGTAAGIVDTVGIDAFAGSTLCTTWSAVLQFKGGE